MTIPLPIWIIGTSDPNDWNFRPVRKDFPICTIRTFGLNERISDLYERNFRYEQKDFSN